MEPKATTVLRRIVAPKPLSVIAVGLCFALGAVTQVTVLTHATVIDGTGNTPQRDSTIVIENERIRDIGPSSLVQAPPGAATAYSMTTSSPC